MSNLILNYTVDKVQILREFLLEKNISRKTLTRIKYDGDGSIQVNGKEENVRYQLEIGDEVKVVLPSEFFSEHIRYIHGVLDIIYEDEYILIVNKKIDLPSIPSRNEEDASLLEIVNYYFKKMDYKTIPHIVTRLDKNTSGLVLIAKHRHIHALLSKTSIDKIYLALVKGEIEENGIIEANITRENDSIIKRTVSETGDYAKTEYKLVRYFSDKDISLVKLKLYTGRTHQIRVHMKYIGFPLLGDDLYGGSIDLIRRQALHCFELKFEHPITKNIVEVKATMPDDIKSIVEAKG